MPYTMMKLWFVERGNIEQIKSLRRLRHLLRMEPTPMTSVFIVASDQAQAAQAAIDYDEGTKRPILINWLGQEVRAIMPNNIIHQQHQVPLEPGAKLT